MLAGKFSDYLQKQHTSARGKQLSARAASDYVSRCRRIETLLGIDLDTVECPAEDIAVQIEALPESSAAYWAKANLKTAAGCYFQFRRLR